MRAAALVPHNRGTVLNLLAHYPETQLASARAASLVADRAPAIARMRARVTDRKLRCRTAGQSGEPGFQTIVTGSLRGAKFGGSPGLPRAQAIAMVGKIQDLVHQLPVEGHEAAGMKGVLIVK
jgi:hypothetical protein